MPSWTCPNCSRAFNIPAIAVPPVRCSCGHVDHKPEFDGELRKPEAAPVVATVPMDNTEILRSLWRELHTMHLGDWEAIRARYDEWKTRIPSFGCSCNEHFKQMEANYPPDFSSPEAFFRWGWMRHNDVNLRLGKPNFSYEDALRQAVAK